MNKLKNYGLKGLAIMGCLSLGFLNSCTEEFLDEPQNTAGVNEDVIFSNRSTVEAALAGILSNYDGQYRTVDTGGLYSLYFQRTVKGNDIIQSPNWYRFDYGWENREPNFRRPNFNWDFNYENIFYANNIIQSLESSSLSEQDKKELTAAAKALRAFHHFQVAMEFAPAYTANSASAKMPIYSEPAADIESARGGAPVPLTEVFAFVIQDLEEAIVDLPDSRIGKSFVNKAVANGILARVLAYTQTDWVRMGEAARAAYGGDAPGAVVSNNWGSGMDDSSDDEWLWTLFQDGTAETNFFYMAPHCLIDHLVLSYQATYANETFVDMFSDTDTRKLFVDFYGVGATTPWRKYITTKFDFTFASDAPTMRKSEMVLLDAEAEFHKGNEPAAKSLLFALQSARDASAVMSTTSGQALLDEILLERRKELYGEVGVEWFDAKRYQLPINRDANHRVVINVPSNSPLFYHKIPQDELDVNPNFDESINIE